MADKQVYQLTQRVLALSDVFPTQDVAGASGVGNNSIQDIVTLVVGSLTDIQNVKVSLSSAQLLALNTTPVELIPAPGLNKFIKIISATVVFNPVTTHYSTQTALPIAYISSSFITSAAGILGNSNSYSILQNCNIGAGVSSDNIANYINNSVVAGNTLVGSNPTGGDGTVDIYLSYYIITL